MPLALLALALFIGCTSATPASRLKPIYPPAAALDAIEMLQACPELTLLDSAMTEQIEVMSVAYDAHVKATPPVPDSSMQRLPQDRSEVASQQRGAAWYYEQMSASDLAVRLRHLKGYQYPIAKALEACRSQPKGPFGQRSLSDDSRKATMRAFTLLLVLTSGAAFDVEDTSE